MLRLLIAVLLACTFAFVGCSDDDNSPSADSALVDSGTDPDGLPADSGPTSDGPQVDSKLDAAGADIGRD